MHARGRLRACVSAARGVLHYGINGEVIPAQERALNQAYARNPEHFVRGVEAEPLCRTITPAG